MTSREAPPTLRRAEAADGDAVAAVWLASRRWALPTVPPVHSDAEVHDWFATVVLPQQQVWIADANGTVVAVMVLDRDWLEQLYVLPEWTGRGIGSALLDLAKALSPDGLQLWTFQVNDAAQRFYERHGFVAVERTDGHANEEQAPDVRYRWP